MNTFELNKIVGAVLGSLLFVLLVGEFSGLLVSPDHLLESVLDIEIADDSDTAAGDGAEVEEISLAALLAAADAEKGAKVAKKCAACHTFEAGGKHKIGPNLWSILDRDIASSDGFSYSGVLEGLEGNWTYEAMDAFLANPKEYAAGTKMAFAGIKKPGDRAALLLYMRDQHESPPELPAE